MPLAAPLSPPLVVCLVGSTILATALLAMARAHPNLPLAHSSPWEPHDLALRPAASPSAGARARRIPLALRAAITRKAAPDIAAYLPLRFDPRLSTPCWTPNASAGGGEKLCLPAFYLAGGMQCGVADLAARLAHHPLLGKPRDAAPHWWTNHPRSRAGDFARYVRLFSSREATLRLEREPRTLMGDASPASFTFIMAEQLRLHYQYLDAFTRCRDACRGRVPPREHCEACANRSYALLHCYAEAEEATTPLDFNLPALLSTVYAARAPRVVVLLRDPAVRLWIAFHVYGQYPARYGKGVAGFLGYFGNQSAAFGVCERQFGVRRCVLRFEALGPAQADVYYHADQLLKGIYSVFLSEWQRYLRRTLLVMRTEDYLNNPLRALRRVTRHLELPQLTAEGMRAAERERSRDEALVLHDGMPSPEEMRGVRKFYEPFNVELARLLGDRAFLWRYESSASRVGGVHTT
ncbi:hypothetical protein AB1Y20_011076 [Prymnesium parvum]|uniref:Sulfotransferase n=1 Tax=Prymnesium parvum TaxID=97485 RepID=A0AB34ILI7_PRYPA